MVENKLTPEEAKKAYGVQAVKCQFEFGERGDDIVRMITQYISEGWMDWEQATMMLHAVFKPEGDEGTTDQTMEARE